MRCDMARPVGLSTHRTNKCKDLIPSLAPLGYFLLSCSMFCFLLPKCDFNHILCCRQECSLPTLPAGQSNKRR